jgi:hypothetical protein
LDILAQVEIVMNKNREHMCYKCGNIYFQAEYKIVKVPVASHDEELAKLSVKTEYDLTAPQKLVRQRRSQRNRIASSLPVSITQEPLLHTQTDFFLEDKETKTDF